MAAAVGNRRAGRTAGRITLQVTRLGALAAILSTALAAAGAGADDSDALRARGRVLLERYHCGSCHTVPGVAGARGTLAASLDAYGRRSYIAGRVANRPDLLARWITAPESIVPGTAMPNMGVSPADASAMAAYLGGLQ